MSDSKQPIIYVSNAALCVMVHPEATEKQHIFSLIQDKSFDTAYVPSEAITQLQTHVSNLSSTILNIVELWENEATEMKLPPKLTMFNERMKFYRSVFTEAQKVAQPSFKR